MPEPIPPTTIKPESAPIANKSVDMPAVPITIIGTGPGTDLAGVTAVTPKSSQPNFTVSAVIHPLMAILIRFIHAYLMTLVGLVTAALTPMGNMIPHTDFFNLVLTCASLSVVGPSLSAAKDAITIFGRLEGKFPVITDSI